MTYEVINKWDDYTFGGTGLQGYAHIPRQKIVDLLGEPTKPEGRIKERWLLKFEDGTVATIFNDDQTIDDEWCISGLPNKNKKLKESQAVLAVHELFGL